MKPVFLAYYSVTPKHVQSTNHKSLNSVLTKESRIPSRETWVDKMTTADIFLQTGSGPLPSTLKYLRLHWAAHVNQMLSD